MVNLEKLSYLILFLANIQILIIGEIDLDPYFSNKKVKYIFLDKLIEIRVLTAYTNQSKSIARFSKKLIKQILQGYIKKNYTVSKNMKFGK